MIVSLALEQMPEGAEGRCGAETRATDGTCSNFWIAGEVIGTLFRTEEFIERKREARKSWDVRCRGYGCSGQRKMTDDG